MRFEQIKCDTCGKLKGESNHWFKLWVNGNLFSNFCEDPEIEIKKDFCGSVCLIKEVQKCLELESLRLIGKPDAQ